MKNTDIKTLVILVAFTVFGTFNSVKTEAGERRSKSRTPVQVVNEAPEEVAVSYNASRDVDLLLKVIEIVPSGLIPDEALQEKISKGLANKYAKGQRLGELMLALEKKIIQLRSEKADKTKSLQIRTATLTLVNVVEASDFTMGITNQSAIKLTDYLVASDVLAELKFKVTNRPELYSALPDEARERLSSAFSASAKTPIESDENILAVPKTTRAGKNCMRMMRAQLTKEIQPGSNAK